MYKVIACHTVDNDLGRLELSLIEKDGLRITAENHDGDVWESEAFDPVATIIKIFKSSSEAERKDIMAIDFSAFDNKVDLEALQKEVEEAKDTDFAEVPDGGYIVSIEKMEIKTTKAGDKLMFAVQCKIKEAVDQDGDSVQTDQKGRMIFFNRVISGNKNSENWNDGRAIKSVCTWVNELLGEDEEPVTFVNYADFADQILDVFQSVQGSIEVYVTYAAGSFNPIKIEEVFDL